MRLSWQKPVDYQFRKWRHDPSDGEFPCRLNTSIRMTRIAFSGYLDTSRAVEEAAVEEDDAEMEVHPIEKVRVHEGCVHALPGATSSSHPYVALVWLNTFSDL